MARFVVAGKVDCAAYARAEILADQLKTYLPDFHVHKVPVPSKEWVDWVKGKCEERGWAGHSGDVMVWRELVKRGGRGMYVGGVKEFEEYASHYHNITPLTNSSTEDSIAMENKQLLDADRLEAESRAKPRPLRVAITAASSSLAHHLLHLLAVGDVIKDQPISLRLLDTHTHSDELSGVAMEITDMASPTVESVHYTSSVKEAFQLASVVFILDQCVESEIEKSDIREVTETKVAGDEKENEERAGDEKEKDAGKEGEKNCSNLTEAADLYHRYGATLDFCAEKSVRVVVCGPFSNLGASIIARSASSLSPGHIVAAPCLAELQARSFIASRLGLNTADIEQVCVWGRCEGGDSVLMDVSETRVRHYQGAIVGPDPFSLPLSHCLHDSAWLTRGLAEEAGKRERGKGLSEAVAVAEMVRHWFQPQETENWIWYSVGVVSDGELYGFPVGVACSVPVRSEGGEWEVVRDVHISPAIQEQLDRQRDSLSQELEMAWKHIESNKL